jgi:transposase-like protein
VECPYCLSSEAYARAVMVSGNQRTYTFTCNDCARSWEGETHTHPIIDQVFGTLKIQTRHGGD